RRQIRWPARRSESRRGVRRLYPTTPRSYHARLVQGGDLVGIQTEQLTEDDVVVLAQARRPALDLPVGTGEMHRHPVDADVAHLRVVHGGPQAPLGRGGIVV